MEELINFGHTTYNGAMVLRSSKYICNRCFALFNFENPLAVQSLSEHHLQLNYFLTLSVLLKAAEQSGFYEVRLLKSFSDFIQDPQAWMQKRGFNYK